ncbi:tryptophan 7-halogenase [Cuspidothrix issatschenkoi LEGE 03284]|uniref:tryptophan halogenase family protein n=1 Tax=Cuspidothrix issatschenkoi TaxID=230752 RepID=UPI00187E1106|nr:tryptophan halogenase family protein [Cuspidothrix issatschenkoi]MBE9231801.1 tryptophan 7-halogenase [Cuspidothrix issatschenkoi LEGE 03284]
MMLQNPQQIQNIVILGGGSAGWLSATYLNKILNGSKGRPCQITLIESSDIGIIGVGEATIHTFPGTLKLLGISESEWMVKCNATFKNAIKFVNWSGLPGKDVYWHPLTDLLRTKDLSIPIFHYWLQSKLQGNSAPVDASCFPVVELSEAKKSPKSVNNHKLNTQVGDYGYHLDAGLLATYLKEKGKSEGIRQIVDNVLDVSLDENGFIHHLVTENHGEVAGDLFIDCSGFSGRLINQALEEPFISYSDSLLCDRAVALPVFYESGDKYNENRGGINPYTTSTALSSGWAWNTPLVERSGNGYVYASAFISPEQAEMELRQHLQEYSTSARHLQIRVGKSRNSWVKNCVSIGLSSGFIEPLESTGIYLIEAGLYYLVKNFPNQKFDPIHRDNYNLIMQNLYEDIRDFIVLHYCLTQREDTPFWQANKYNLNIPDSLQERLEKWRFMWPTYNFSGVSVPLFGDYSYVCILAGMGYLPQQALPIVAYQQDLSTQLFAQLGKHTQHLKNSLPDHIDYLRDIHQRGILT